MFTISGLIREVEDEIAAIERGDIDADKADLLLVLRRIQMKQIQDFLDRREKK